MLKRKQKNCLSFDFAETFCDGQRRQKRQLTCFRKQIWISVHEYTGYLSSQLISNPQNFDGFRKKEEEKSKKKVKPTWRNISKRWNFIVLNPALRRGQITFIFYRISNTITGTSSADEAKFEGKRIVWNQFLSVKENRKSQRL